MTHAQPLRLIDLAAPTPDATPRYAPPSIAPANRLVLSNLMVEAGAKAAIFSSDARTAEYRRGRMGAAGVPVAADPGAASALSASSRP